jgi:glycosyltransferase involved in cell wall biosynthesis
VRILIVQRSLSPPGGGNAVAAWMIHALAGEHDVGSLTMRPWSVAETNAFYGTAIPAAAVTQHVVPLPWRWLAGLRESRLTRLRSASVYGASRRLASRYDLMITAEYYAAFAQPGIQYVQFPALLHPPPERLPLLVNSYFALCEWVLGAPWSNAARNMTIANSRWTAEGIERLGELSNPLVLYPPVLDPGAGVPWADRDDTFLCIGRFDASKRIEAAIAIVKQVKSTVMPAARLLIVGSPVDAEYTSRIRRIASGQPWIEFQENVSRAGLNALMARSRYGLQAMVAEHFGMATAEMTRAGCLVFAHRSGGTPEVLNQEDALLWLTEEEAVQRITQVSGSNAASIAALRARLQDNARSFSVESFAHRLREIVAGLR